MQLFELFATLGLKTNEFDTGIGAARSKFSSFAASLQSGMNSVNGVVNKGIGVLSGAATVIGGLLAKTGMGFNMQMESYQTNFEILLGSAQKATQKVAQLRDYAAKTPFEMSDVSNATSTLLTYGVVAEKVDGIMRQLGDVALGDSERLNSLALVFGQVSSNMKLNGEDYRQFISLGFNPLNYIAQRTGESMTELYKRMSDGKITLQEVEQAFTDATSEGGLFFEGTGKAAKTTLGLLSTFKDDASMFLGEVFQPINDALKSQILPKLSSSIVELQDAFRKATGYVEPAADVLGNVGDAATNAQSWLDSLITNWTDGKKESDELVNQFITDFKTDSDKLREAVQARRKALAESGGDTTGLDSALEDLDKYDKEIETLLKKKQNGYFSEDDKKRLQEITEAKKVIENMLNLNGAATEAGEVITNAFGDIAVRAIERVKNALVWVAQNFDKVKAAIKAVVVAVTGFKIAMAATNLVMNANPATMLITAIMGLAAAFTYFYETNEEFRDGVIKVWDGVKEGVGKVTAWITGTFDSMKKAYARGAEKGGIFGGIVEGAKTLGTKLKSVMGSALVSAGKAISKNKYFNGLGKKLIEAGFAFQEGEKVDLSGVLSAVKVGVTLLWSDITAYLKGIDWGGLWNALWNGIADVGKWITDVTLDLGELANKCLEGIRAWAEGDPLEEGLTGMSFSGVWDAVATAVTNLSKWVPMATIDLAELAGKLLGNIGGLATELITKVKEALTGGGDRESLEADDLLSEGETGKISADDILKALVGTGEWALEVAKTFTGALVDAFTGQKGTWDGIVTSITDAFAPVKEFFANLATDVGKANGIVAILEGIGGAITTYSLGTVLPKVAAGIKGLVTALTATTIPRAIAKIKDLFTALTASNWKLILLSVAVGAVVAAIKYLVDTWDTFQDLNLPPWLESLIDQIHHLVDDIKALLGIEPDDNNNGVPLGAIYKDNPDGTRTYAPVSDEPTWGDRNGVTPVEQRRFGDKNRNRDKEPAYVPPEPTNVGQGFGGLGAYANAGAAAESVSGLSSAAEAAASGAEAAAGSLEGVSSASDAAAGDVGGLGSAAKGTAGGFMGVISGLSSLKQASTNFAAKINGLEIKAPSVPGLTFNAKGGIFKKASLLGNGNVVGEAGVEAALPLKTLWDEMGARFDAAFMKIAGAGGFDYDALADAVTARPIVYSTRIMARKSVRNTSAEMAARQKQISRGRGGR